jgi:hypothetical protein
MIIIIFTPLMLNSGSCCACASVCNGWQARYILPHDTFLDYRPPPSTAFLHGCLRCMHSVELSLHGLHEVAASMTEGEVISLGKFSMMRMVLCIATSMSYLIVYHQLKATIFSFILQNVCSNIRNVFLVMFDVLGLGVWFVHFTCRKHRLYFVDLLQPN